MSQDLRKFTVLDSSVGFSGGTYNSTNPAGAAHKAGRQMYLRLVRNNASCPKLISFTLREKGGESRVYETKRTKRKKAITYSFAGQKFTSEYEYTTRAV